MEVYSINVNYTLLNSVLSLILRKVLVTCFNMGDLNI
jgi:hypothetical protein